MSTVSLPLACYPGNPGACDIPDEVERSLLFFVLLRSLAGLGQPLSEAFSRRRRLAGVVATRHKRDGLTERPVAGSDCGTS